MKKFLSILLAMSLMLSLLPAQAEAAEAESISASAPEDEMFESLPEEAAGAEMPESSPEVSSEESETSEKLTLLAERPTSGVCGENLTWVLDSNGTLTVSGTGAMANYTSPTLQPGGQAKDVPWYWVSNDITDIVIGDGVTSIGDYAFYDCINLRQVTIPGNISSVGTQAFKTCDSLASVTILDGVTSIGRDAFADCTQLSKIVIPASVVSIPYGAFSGCTSLVAAGAIGGGFNFEFGWSAIPAHAFYECPGLVSITIPSSVTSIGAGAFSYCRNLTKVTMPANAIVFSGGAFSGCTGLTSAGPVGEGYSYEFGWTNEIPVGAFSGCTSLTGLTIPASITKIANGEFSGNPGLTSAGPIGGGYSYEFGWTKEIPDYAFSGCGQLTNIVLPDGITSIGSQAFKNCKSLTSATIPSSVTSIGEQAFYHCENLGGVTIPSGVTSIGRDAFAYCTGLTSAGPIGGGYNYEFGWATEIPSYAFKGCGNLTSVIIPDGITSIRREAFSGCSNLSLLTIPDSVATIEYCAFYGCKSLTNVTIPDSVTTIEREAFSNCTGLTKVTVPASVTKISEGNVFSGCSGLTSAGPIGGGYAYEFGWTTQIPDYAFKGCTSLTSVSLPNGITNIGSDAFYNCSKLTGITIPASVTSIGYGAFRYCGSLTSVTIPRSVTSIGDFAFYDSSSLTDVYYTGSEADWAKIKIDLNNKPMESATIHYNTLGPGCPVAGTCGVSAEWRFEDGVLTISGSWEMYDFRLDTVPEDLPPWYNLRDQIEKIVIDEGITIIGKNAFNGCANLQDVSIPNSVISIKDNAFEGCSNLKYIVIPDSVVSIGDFAFGNCKSLIKADLPAKITRIGERTFASCGNLRSIVIPDGVTEIGEYAFQECSKMLMAVIPKSVTEVGDGAFVSSGLTDVYYSGAKQEWGNTHIGQNTGLNDTGINYHFNKGNPSANNHIIKVDMTDLDSTFLNTDELLEIYIYFDQELDKSAISEENGTMQLSVEGKTEPIRIGGSDMYFYVDSDDLTRMVISFNNSAAATWESRISPAIPYGSALTLSLDSDTVKFANPAVNFPGIGAGSDDRFSVQTKWGMTPDIDWLSFSNEYSSFDDAHWTVSSDIFAFLTGYSVFDDSYHKIQQAVNNDAFNGSCLGMCSVMALAETGELDLRAWDTDATVCYKLTMPCNSKKSFGTRDLINYYHLLQHLPQYPLHIAYTGFVENILDKSAERWDVVAKDLVKKAQEFQTSKTPLLIHLKFKDIDNELVAHECLAYSYSEDMGNYILGLYDPSYPSTVTILKIDKNTYRAELYGAWKSNTGGLACKLVSLGYIDPNDLKPYNIDRFAATAKTYSLDAVDNGAKAHAVLYVGINEDCTITNSAGAYLRCHDGAFEGTMKIYTLRSVGSGTTAEYRIEVDASDSFVCNADNSEVGFTVYQNGSYLEAVTTNKDVSIAVAPGESVSLSGQGILDYQVFSSVDFDNGDLVTITGQSVGAVGVFHTEDKKIQLAADNITPAAIGLYNQTNVTEFELDPSRDGPVISTSAPISYTITFNANGGTVAAATVPTNPNGRVVLLPVPARVGYTFKGWYTTPTEGERITLDTVFAKDTTVYAQWDYAAPTVCEKYKGLYTAEMSRNGKDFILTLTPCNGNVPASDTIIVWQAYYRQGKMTAIEQVLPVSQASGLRFAGTISSGDACSLFVLDKALAPIIEKYYLGDE